MPPYLILRVISFIIAVGLAITLPLATWYLTMLLAIVHYCLAIPYSKKLIFDALSRPASRFYLFTLIAAALAISIPPITGMLFFAFGFHFVLSEVYLMHENIVPHLWKETRALRVTSILFNLTVYFATTKLPILFVPFQQVEAFIYAGCATCVCAIPFLLYRLRKSLTRDQIVQICAFESLGLAFVLLGMVQPAPPTVFILYHVLFWLFYPPYKMIQHGNIKSLVIFAAANIGLTGLLALLMPFSPSPEKLSNVVFSEIFRIGSLFHIITSFGMTTAQPAWITRIFHPNFVHGSKSPTLPTVSQTAVKALATQEHR